MEAKLSAPVLSAAIQLENTEDYQGAVVHYLKAIQLMANSLCDQTDSSKREKLEIQYNLNTSIARAKFLVGIMQPSIDVFGSQQISKIQNGTSESHLSHCSSLMSLNYIATNLIQQNLSNSVTYTNSRCISTSTRADQHFQQEMEECESASDIIVSHKNMQETTEVETSCNLIKDQLMNSILIETPNISMKSVIGMESAKQPIREAVMVPLLFPNSVQAKNAWKGILLFGPSGVGKTQLIKAVATEATNTTFINVRVDNILSKWLGDTEKSVRALFEIARERSPSIMFIDEVDALCGARGAEESESSRRLKNALLTEMDGMQSSSNGADGTPSRVIVIGNTNIPQALDQAFLRRFPKRIYVPLPKNQERKMILQHSISQYENSLVEADFENLSFETIRFSGADLITLVTTAGMRALEDSMKDVELTQIPCIQPGSKVIRPVNIEDFRYAFKNTSPTNDSLAIRAMETWNEKFGDGKSSRGLEESHGPKIKVSKTFKVFSSFLEFFSGF